jgi:hypothetical protein
MIPADHARPYLENTPKSSRNRYISIGDETKSPQDTE